jgi:hypothetical protein
LLIAYLGGDEARDLNKVCELKDGERMNFDATDKDRPPPGRQAG